VQGVIERDSFSLPMPLNPIVLNKKISVRDKKYCTKKNSNAN
jgi:hypothetical protein